MTVDLVCQVTDLPSAAKGVTEPSTTAPCTETDNKLVRWQCGQVAKFHAPRATGTLVPLNCSSAPASAGSRHALYHPKPDPTPQQNSLQPCKKARTAEQTGPGHSAAKRSGTSSIINCTHAFRQSHRAASLQMMISFVSSSALENCLGQKTHTLQIVAPHRYSMYHAGCLVHSKLTTCNPQPVLLLCRLPLEAAVQLSQLASKDSLLKLAILSPKQVNNAHCQHPQAHGSSFWTQKQKPVRLQQRQTAQQAS